eukprot:CAMPEP_0174989904 /NCGR_PEP_ID=MMETSP0004_2-20121128/20999_1 /TAXON_ID=420556 /ORGANISM="Ochromonas sp., Strain CCMP1393" /LENGTH=1166 /DNA_ID=CAMNT_0016243401 /DNA_START=22 /DNA_END=3525 /DNA_ORIENTATION=-
MSYQSFKWISSGEQKGSKALEVNEAVQHSVFKSVARSPCNLISIFGRARQGKSFLMNCLAGEKEIFRISNEKESCTQGIDISNKWCNWSDFERIDGGGGGGRTGRQHTDMKVGFVDAEGQGDKDVGYDANLICPILLTSKCVIFNWKGDLQKDHLLSTLGIMTRAAANVASETSSGTKASFGHLHIIFRDWQAEGASEQAVFDDIMKPERTEEGETRNLIRSQLKNSFQSIRVWLFVAPMERTKDLKQKLEYQKTCAEFRDQVRALRGALSGQLLEPTLFAGNALTGKTYVRLTQQVAQALNAGQSVLPSSAYLNMMKEEAQVLVQQYEQELRARMQTLLISLNDEVHHHQQQPQARSNSSSSSSSSHHKNAQSLYATLPDAQNRFSLLCKELTQEYVGRVSESIGGDAKATAARDAGSVAAAVLADFTTQLQEIGVNMQQHYQAAYGQQFTSWLLGARQAAEQLIDFQLLVLEKKLPIEQSAAPSTQQDNSTSSAATFSKLSLSANSGNRDTGGSSAATLEKELQSVLNAALRMIGGTDHYGAQCIEVVDASKILCRHHESRAQQLMQKNQQLLATSAARAEECLQAAVAAMEAELERSLDQHDSLYSSGYQLQLLQMALNKSYYQLRDENIRTALKDSVHLAGVEERFQASSVALSTLMLAAYRARKQRALTAAVQHGVGEIGDALTEMDIGKLWAGVDIDAREATMDLCLQDMQNRMEGSLLGSEVRGWLVLRQNRRFAPCPLNELLQTFHNNNNNITSSTSGSSGSVTGSSACEYSEVANALAAASQWELEELQMELAFVSELRSSMQQAARGFRDSGLALLQRLRYQERDAATKAAAVEAARAAAQQAEEEEEEEEEEEVGSQHDGATLIDEEEDEEQEMESPPPAAANKRSGSSSAAEQRRRAQEWAANNLAGMSNKKKKTRPSTASAAAAECRATEAAAASAGIQQGGRSRKSRSATAAAVLPPKSTKSVEQQRQDALAYARRVFGERVRIPSPPPPPLPLPSSTTGAGASAASSGRHSHKKRKTRDIHVDDDEMEAADAVNSSDNPFSANYNAHHPSSNLPSSISNPRRPGKENAPSLDQPSPPGPLASSSSSSSSATTATTTSSKAIHNTGSTKKGDKLRAAREEAKLIAQQRADAAAAAAADRVARNKAKKAAGKK